MPSKPQLTQAAGQKALDWLQGQMGLEHWRITLLITDDMPAWAVTGPDDGCGRLAYEETYLRAKVWLSPAMCLTEGRDALHTLFHEVVHLFLVNADVNNDSDKIEFMVDRIADAWAFAYRHGMKPWR